MTAVRLKELCQIKHGGTPSKSNPAFWSGRIPWVSPKDMKSSVLTDAIDHISEEAVTNSATTIAPEGSTLVVARSGILVHSIPVAQVSRPVAFNQDIKALIPNTTKIDPDYLFWFVRGKEQELLGRGVKNGATVHSLQSGILENLLVPLPRFDEQRRIVDFLSTAEGIVSLRRAAEKKAQEIIPALFLDMFGDPTTNPKGWPAVQFGSLVTPIDFGISAALSKDAEYQPGRTGVIRIANLTGAGRLDLSDVRYLSISEKKKARLLLKEGDLLFNWRNSPNWIGKTAVVDSNLDCIFASFLYRFRALQDRAETTFIWFYLNYLRERGFFARMCRQAVSQANVGREELATIRVMAPPLTQQKIFAERCRPLFALRVKQEAAAEKARAVLNALLARVFGDAERETGHQHEMEAVA